MIELQNLDRVKINCEGCEYQKDGKGCWEGTENGKEYVILNVWFTHETALLSKPRSCPKKQLILLEDRKEIKETCNNDKS